MIISFGTLCFMHLVLRRNFFFFFFANFFNGSGHGLSKSGQVDPQKNRIGSRVNLFLLRVKKIGFESGIFRVGSGRVRKFWPVLPCLMSIHHCTLCIIIYHPEIANICFLNCFVRHAIGSILSTSWCINTKCPSRV